MSGDQGVEDGVGEVDDGYEESAYEVARRLYGRRLEPRTRRELERSLEAWRELGSADRTFVLAHLGMMRLRALEELPFSDQGLDSAPTEESGSGLLPSDEDTEEMDRVAASSQGGV